jgi:hypothetical protein
MTASAEFVSTNVAILSSALNKAIRRNIAAYVRCGMSNAGEGYQGYSYKTLINLLPMGWNERQLGHGKKVGRDSLATWDKADCPRAHVKERQIALNARALAR